MWILQESLTKPNVHFLNAMLETLSSNKLSKLTDKKYLCINIIGSGSMGHLLALLLQKTKQITPFETDINDELVIDLYARKPRKSANWKYQSPTATFNQTIQYYSLNQWKQPDLIIICIKSPHLKALCQQLSKLSPSNKIDSSIPILIMMNGMGLIETVLSYFPNNPIFQATTTHGAKIDKDILFHTGSGDTYIGVQQNVGNRQNGQNTEQLKGICKLLNKQLPTVHKSQNIEQSLWRKLLINAVINPLTTIHNINNGQVTNNLAIKNEALQLCDELAPFIKKLYIFDDRLQLFEQVCLIANQTKDNISSMRQDHLKHRLSEIDFITGYLLKTAKTNQIQLPLHTKIYRKIKTLENHF
ncbi:MAG: 2-dehydropantoate 2-reductase [Polaribacter sp.]|jgi:2-dehydropantoate 2-reductase